MNRKELNKLNMLRSVYSFLTANLTIVSEIGGMPEFYAQLGKLIADLENAATMQVKGTRSATKTKEELESKVIKRLLKVAGGLRAYAIVNKIIALKTTADLQANTVAKLRDNDLVSLCNLIYNEALPYADKLAPHKVSEADVNSLDADTKAYNASFTGKRDIQEKTVGATQNIASLLTESNQFVQDMDDLMFTISETEPELITQYRVARKIIRLAATRKGNDAPPEGAGGSN